MCIEGTKKKKAHPRRSFRDNLFASYPYSQTRTRRIKPFILDSVKPLPKIEDKHKLFAQGNKIDILFLLLRLKLLPLLKKLLF